MMVVPPQNVPRPKLPSKVGRLFDMLGSLCWTIIIRTGVLWSALAVYTDMNDEPLRYGLGWWDCWLIVVVVFFLTQPWRYKEPGQRS